MTGPVTTEAPVEARTLVQHSLKVGAPGLSETAREAVLRSIMLKLEGKVLAPLLAVLRQVTAERDEARDLAYELKLAAAGGEDVPGSANLVTAEDVRRWRDEDTRQLATATSELARLRAEGEEKDRVAGCLRASVREFAQAADRSKAEIEALLAALDQTKAAADDLVPVCIAEGDNKAAGALQFISGFVSDRLAASEPTALAHAVTAREGQADA